MRLVHLRLRNIRSYRDADVGFGEGITLFEGDIGSGKSTILLAIEFALFGLGDTDSTHILRHGSKGGEVELTIDLEGRAVRILRSLRRLRKKAQVDRCVLDIDGSVEELSSADMKPRVLELLGYNENPDPKAKSDIFRFGVYTPQEDMRSILDTRQSMREQRKETIRRALRIQEFRVARDNLGVVASHMKSRREGHEEAAQGIEEARRRLDEARRTLDQEGEERDRLAKAVMASEAAEAEARKRRDTLEARAREADEAERGAEMMRTALAKAEGEAELVTARLEAARRELERFESLRGRLAELEGVQEELELAERRTAVAEESRTRLEEARRRASELEARLAASREAKGQIEGLERELGALGDLPARRKGLEADLEELDASLREMDMERAGIASRAEVLEAELEQLSSLEGEKECPRCRQALTPEHLEGLLQRDRKELRRCTGGLRELASRSRKVEEERVAARGELEEVSRRERQNAVLEDKLATSRSEAGREGGILEEIDALGIKGLEEEHRNARDAVDDVRHKELVALAAERVDTIRRLEGSEAMAVEVSGLEAREREATIAARDARAALSRRERALEKAVKGFDREALADATLKHTEASQALAERRTELREVERRIAMAGEMVAEREERVRGLETHVQMARAHDDLHRWLTQCFRPSLEDIELRVLSIMHEEMDAAAKGWFERLVEDPDLEMEVDEEFVPTVTQQGFDVTVDALSGGERTAVAFAYRLALNGLVQRIATPGRSNLLMLDEPTDGFSREQLVRMGGLLPEVGADQVIIVSHDSELEAFADRVYVVRKASGASHVTLAS